MTPSFQYTEAGDAGVDVKKPTHKIREKIIQEPGSEK